MSDSRDRDRFLCRPRGTTRPVRPRRQGGATHGSGIAPALGLRAWNDVPSFDRKPREGDFAMSFTSWLRNVRSALVPSRGGRKQRRRPLRVVIDRPRLELLEDRCLLSFSPAASYPTGAVPQAVLTADF